MIVGVVNQRLEAVISLRVQGPAAQQEVDVVIDTGFSGSLTLPTSIIQSSGLPWRSRGKVILANGAIEPFDIHSATVIWDGSPKQILIDAADTQPLIGMRLLENHDLRIQAVVGGEVIIYALP